MNDAARTAAAHAETPTCNAGPADPFTCHSLKCRTRALEMAQPAPPPLTVIQGGRLCQNDGAPPLTAEQERALLRFERACGGRR